MTKIPRPYGLWPSPLSATDVAGHTLRFGDLATRGHEIYWTESRPDQQGRAVLMKATPDQSPQEILPNTFSVRTRVHEYGGGAFHVTADTIFFANDEDDDLWWIKDDGAPQRITRAPDLRFADFIHDPHRQRLIAVAECAAEAPHHGDNKLVTISLAPDHFGRVTDLLTGDDFYAAPRLSPDGHYLAFVSWNLPNMPWDCASLQLASLTAAGQIETVTPLPGLENSASFQPQWREDGTLFFINDRTGYGQLYAWRPNGHNGKASLVTRALPSAEMGLPHWVFGMRSYALLGNDGIAVALLENGNSRLVTLDREGNVHTSSLATQCNYDTLTSAGEHLAAFVSNPRAPAALSLFAPGQKQPQILRQSAPSLLPAEDIAVAEPLTFANERGQQVQGFYYPPNSGTYTGPDHVLPPVILTAHGGPTAFADCGFKPKVQFWTSRGFGWFDINYSGSWGFGRAYRQRLDGQWGLRDVADMVAAARHLIDTKRADPRRLLISGSSAGGYTVLMALANSNVFAAGASYYGISDMALLRNSTHKFEAGYIDSLIGLTGGEEDNALLRIRSPLHLADRIRCPVIFFQGLKDKVVPPSQAEHMVTALKARSIDVAYETFPEESHGFRRSEAIERALTLEYNFYLRVLGIEDAA